MNQEENKKVYIKKCKHCGKEFETTNSRRMYCDKKCKAAADNVARKVRMSKKEPVVYEKTCPNCNKTFKTLRKSQTYCCFECSHSHYNKVNKEKILANKKRYYEENKHLLQVKNKKYREQHKEELLGYQKRYRQENKEKVKNSSKKYRENHKEEQSLRNRIYYQKNKEKMNEYKKVYYQKNKEKINEHRRVYYEKNREKIRERNRILYQKNKKERSAYCTKRIKERLVTDPNFRITRLCRKYVRRCLSSKKIGRTQEILGYTSEELKCHLEKYFYANMSWDDVREWEVHHIKPLDTFNFINEDGTDNYDIIREANALNNLVPLFIEDHKKLTRLYLSEKKWLSLEEIKQMIKEKE